MRLLSSNSKTRSILRGMTLGAIALESPPRRLLKIPKSGSRLVVISRIRATRRPMRLRQKTLPTSRSLGNGMARASKR